MMWIVFVIGAFVSWGMYGPTLHKGQVQLGHPMRALLCVGVAYFLLGVLIPAISLYREGKLNGFTTSGTTWAIMAGSVGAMGAICIIYAFKAGGSPLIVMPLVFAGAPVVNVLVSSITSPPKTSPNPMLYLGFVLAAAGAGMVLYFKPTS